jgi:hypothetical protein
MDAFFVPGAPRSAPETQSSPPRVRTTVTLSQEDADRLELLRMRLRHRQGRGLTYSDVVALALRRLEAAESDGAGEAPTDSS